MRKCAFSFVFLFVFTYSLFAFEMWNGITTEMSMDSIISRLKTIFEDTLRNKSGDGWGKGKPEIFFVDTYQQSRIYPDDLISYWFRSEVPTYHFLYTNSSPVVYFRNNKLFAIRVPFAADADIVFNAAKEKYGSNFEKLTENYPLYSGEKRVITIYKWETNEKTVYLHSDPKNGTWQPRIITIINKQLFEEYKQEQIRKDEKNRQELEEQRRAANDGVKF